MEEFLERQGIVAQLAIVAVLIAIAVSIMFYLSGQNPNTESRRVTFRVDASGGFANITLQAGSVKISKTTTVTVPWIKTVAVKTGSEVYLTASNPTQTGKLTCTILLDKQPWKTASTNAPKDGVACAGIVP